MAFAMSTMAWLWAAAMVIFLLVEAAAPGLICIWFALGALAAMISAALNGPVWLQFAWFLVVSAATLAVTRPLVKKYVNSRKVATNADRNIGRSAVVTERIDNLAAAGAVQLDGVVWTARSVDDAPIEAGERVVVREIQGVKLLVERESAPEA